MVQPQRGFTLIELLVTIVIVGVVSTIIFAAFGPGFIQRSRDAKRKSDLQQLKTALEMYRSDNGTYPVTTSWFGTCSTFGSKDVTGANGYVPNLAPTYIETLPTDPKSGQVYPPCNDGGATCYVYCSGNNWCGDGGNSNYKLLAHCSPEAPGAYGNSSDPFYDSLRPTWAWQVHSGVNSAGW